MSAMRKRQGRRSTWSGHSRRGFSMPSRRVHQYRQFGIAFDKTGVDTLRFTNHLHGVKSLHDFFPHDTQLHFSQAVAHAAVNSKAEAQVLSRIGTIDPEFIGALDGVLVPISGGIPHDYQIGRASCRERGEISRGAV